MECPQEEDAKVFLEKHKILELFSNLTGQLIYERPNNPKAFMVDYLEKLQKSRASKLDYPSLFDESNIKSVFGMLDPTDRGFITLEHYKNAMDTLGIKTYNVKPVGSDLDRIPADTFYREAKLGIAHASATFAEKK